jgi:hypothetical protein
MKRVSPASVLLLVGGVLVLVGLPLQWSTVATTDGSISLSLRGTDYAGYDIVTTIVLGLLLVAAAFAIAGGVRWGRVLAVVAAVLTSFWAALVYLAAASPASGGSTITGVDVSVGAGAYVLAAGALLGLIGAVLSFRGRGLAAVAAPGAQPSV